MLMTVDGKLHSSAPAGAVFFSYSHTIRKYSFFIRVLTTCVP